MAETAAAEAVPGLRGVALVKAAGGPARGVAQGTLGTDPDALCTLDTRFQLASVSKQFTAAATLLLSDSGVLAVADPVSKWLDGCPPAWETITLHHLLSHTSGIAHWPATGIDLTEPLDTAEELRIFQATPLLAVPGEKYSYSSPAYTMLALVVERAAGQPYESFLRQRIFDPLGMSSTFAGSGHGEAHMAQGHEAGEAVKQFELDTVGMGAGDVWSTAGDMATWNEALADGSILTEESRQAMFSVQAPLEEESGPLRAFGYGYAWYLCEYAGHSMRMHTGDNAGFVAVNAWFVDLQLSLVVLSNDHTCDLMGIAAQLLDM
ncbi:MAG TPA: serine hydrolase domain-containing protein [Acidimicrobiales bacterium]|nr:serine hydrolase domain-containing protein [Acidimicrobiales bacterium]